MAIKNIAVSVTGAAHSLIAAKYSIYLSKLLGAKLTGIYVIDEKSLHELLKTKIFVEVEAIEFQRELEEQGRRFFERVKALALNKGVEFEGLMLKGVVHTQVVHKVQELNSDLLVIGELREVKSMTEVFYNPGERILRESPCPVVVVKNQAEVERLYKEM
jgi:nucleotide-binding universal stress UspA family protein